MDPVVLREERWCGAGPAGKLEAARLVQLEDATAERAGRKFAESLPARGQGRIVDRALPRRLQRRARVQRGRVAEGPVGGVAVALEVHGREAE